MDSFIIVRHRDETAISLLAPSQDIYLRGNIRSCLLVAAQAVPRHQEETWKQPLDNVSTWTHAYYDAGDATAKAFLNEVGKLNQQSIIMMVPETLQSQTLLEKLMQTRVRSLMAQPVVTADGAPSPAPVALTAPAAPQGEQRMLKTPLLFTLLIIGIVLGPAIAGHQNYVLIQTGDYNTETSVTGLVITPTLVMMVLFIIE